MTVETGKLLMTAFIVLCSAHCSYIAPAHGYTDIHRPVKAEGC